MEALIAALHRAGVSIRDIATEEPDLEDVFLDLTGSGAHADPGQ
jgi:ABC-2 type transport system ATP-binding protein